jgi:hypothetical protein
MLLCRCPGEEGKGKEATTTTLESLPLPSLNPDNHVTMVWTPNTNFLLIKKITKKVQQHAQLPWRLPSKIKGVAQQQVDSKCSHPVALSLPRSL